MQHYFDVDIAKEYGVLEAILLNNFLHWIEKNKANGKNYYDGYYWTYNSTRAFNELFPYVSERQIKNALKHLREEGILQTGNYNKVAYDRTLWYAFTEKGQSIVQKCPIHCAKMSNGEDDNVQPIPNINTDDKPNDKKERKKKQTSYDEVINSKVESDEIKELLYEFIKMRALKKKPLTDRALSIQINKLFKLSSDLETQKQIIENSIVKCWDEFYELKGENKNVINKGSNQQDLSKYDR